MKLVVLLLGFITHHNAQNIDMVLRTELHSWALSLGMERPWNYRIFRNEGWMPLITLSSLSASTEVYQAYATPRHIMDLTEGIQQRR